MALFRASVPQEARFLVVKDGNSADCYSGIFSGLLRKLTHPCAAQVARDDMCTVRIPRSNRC